MDITDIYLNKLYSAEKLYSYISETLENENISDKNSLINALNSISEKTEFRIYISDESVSDSAADEVLLCFTACADSNSNISLTVTEDEFLNVLDDEDRLTSAIAPRSVVHKTGLNHATVHIWFIRRKDMGIHVLLQKRSHKKEIAPDMYDVSAAGHISQGHEFRKTALKEIREELGLEVPSNSLEFIGMRHGYYTEGEITDKELTAVYLYKGEFDESQIALQESEVSEVHWAEIDELITLIKLDSVKTCISLEELDMIKKAVF